jgi:hypothetical protein
MKTTLITLLHSALILMGSIDNPTDPTSSDAQITNLSTSPNWVKLPSDKGQDFSIESKYSAQKLIKGEEGGVIKLNIKIERPVTSSEILKLKQP